MPFFNETTRKWWLLATMCLLSVMLNIDVAAVNLAIPSMAHQLHASLANMQWVINAFALVPAMFTILGGQLGDIGGQRRIFLLGTIIFIIGSAIAGLATNEFILISGRVAQGFALGIAYPMTIALIYAAFPKHQYGTAMGYIVGTMGFSLAIGPTIGGIIVHFLNWRWIFLINIPVGILTIFLTYATCPMDRVSSNKPKLDYFGIFFLITGLFCFILALNQSQNWGLISVKFWATFLIGILLLIILFFTEKRISMPLVDFSLFKSRDFLLHNLIRIVTQIVFVPLLFFVPIYLQNIAGFSALYAGVLMLSMTIILGILSPFVGQWVDRFGAKICNMLAMILFFIGCLLFSCLNSQPNLWLLNSALFIIGIATSIAFVATTAGAIGAIPENQSGSASGIFFTNAWGSVALGIAIVGAIIAISSHALLNNYLLPMQNYLSKIGIYLAPTQIASAARVASGISPAHLLAIQPFPVNLTAPLATQAFMHGFYDAMIFLAFVSVIGFIFSLRLKN